MLTAKQQLSENIASLKRIAETVPELIAETIIEMTEAQRLAAELECAAEDCNTLFTPTPRSHGQKYCSTRCRTRIHNRKIRDQAQKT